MYIQESRLETNYIKDTGVLTSP